MNKESRFTSITAWAVLAMIVFGLLWNTPVGLKYFPHHVIGMPEGSNTYEEVSAKATEKHSTVSSEDL